MTESVVSFRPADAAVGRSRTRVIGAISSFLIVLVVYQRRAPVKHEGPLPGPFETRRATRDYATTRTFVACGPFAPSVASNSTLAPSERLLKPSPAMPV